MVSGPLAGSREALYAVACAAMFVFGMILALPGTVLGLPEAAAQFELTLADRGTLISTLFLGLLLGSLASGPVVDALGQRRSVVLSCALVAVCLPMFALARAFLLGSVALFSLGFACAGMNTAANALSSDLFPDERGRRMNGIALAVGAGGLTLPMVTALASGVLSWRVIVVAGALLSAAVAVAGARVRTPEAAVHAGGGSLSAFAHFLRQPRFGWFCALLMLGAANEASMAGWTSTYLSAAGFSPAAATWALSSHWLGLITGRLMLSRRVDRDKTRALVRAALATAGGVAIFVTTDAPVPLAAAPFAIGVAMAIIVPTSLALAGDRYRGNAGTLFGILLTLAQVGGMVIPPLIGVAAERTSVAGGMSLLVANAVLIAAVAWRAGRAAG
jgi:fucose permease